LTLNVFYLPSTPQYQRYPTIFAFLTSTALASLAGYQVVWATLAMRSDVEVSRLFTDTHEQLPRSPELVGFSCSWELDYVNILNLLGPWKFRAVARSEAEPLVFGGGPVLTANQNPSLTSLTLSCSEMAKTYWGILLMPTKKSEMPTENAVEPPSTSTGVYSPVCTR